MNTSDGPFKVIAAQLLTFKGVKADFRSDIEGKVLDIEMPSEQGVFKLTGITEDEAGAILLASRGAGLIYHTDNFFKQTARCRGHILELEVQNGRESN